MIGQELHCRQDNVRTVTLETVLNMIGGQTGTCLWPSRSGDRVSNNSKSILTYSDSVVDFFLERPHLGRARARHSSQEPSRDSDQEVREGNTHEKGRPLGESSPSLGGQGGVREDQKEPGGHAENTQEGT